MPKKEGKIINRGNGVEGSKICLPVFQKKKRFVCGLSFGSQLARRLDFKELFGDFAREKNRHWALVEQCKQS